MEGISPGINSVAQPSCCRRPNHPLVAPPLICIKLFAISLSLPPVALPGLSLLRCLLIVFLLAYTTMSQKLSHFDTERFIIEIRRRPSIWDSSSQDYSNRDLTKKCWEEVVEIFGAEALLVKKKTWD